MDEQLFSIFMKDHFEKKIIRKRSKLSFVGILETRIFEFTPSAAYRILLINLPFTVISALHLIRASLKIQSQYRSNKNGDNKNPYLSFAGFVFVRTIHHQY